MIDWSRVEELRREIGETGFAEVVSLFWEEVESILCRLSVDSATQLESDLHFLKGSVWNLGFRDFGALCQHGEKKAAQGRAAEVDLALVAGQYYAAKAAFLGGLSAASLPEPRIA